MITRVQVACIAGFGLALGGLVARQLLLGTPAAGRARAMLALGLVWFPLLVTAPLGLPWLGLAAAMWRGTRAWHVPAVNIAGGLHILVGVLLIFFGLQASPMFVMAGGLTLIGLGTLALLTGRSSPVTSNS